MPKRVVIIGGGFSGLAAGVALAERGFHVRLLERRNHLGGRAYSFIDSRTGDVVDNGQHLFMGCYRHTIDFLKKIDRLDRLRFQKSPRVDFLDLDHEFSSFSCPPLPSPFHALAGLLGMRGITAGDKLRAFNVGRALRVDGSRRAARPAPGGPTVAHWLEGLSQSSRIRERFWYPMSIATLNENPATASAAMLVKVLQEAFGGGRSATRIGISRVGLSDLYTDGARKFIEDRGGTISTGAAVKRLKIERETVLSVELKDGEEIGGDYFISAVPPKALRELLPEDLRAGEFASLARLESSPIVSVNLWFDRPLIDREFVGLIGTRIQWIFSKDLTLSLEKKSHQIAVIISAARDFVDRTREEL
ncbi:MAG TPA: hydroxysqualene dehydroxylase HpnE, partial [Blastocatellia bacterium]|nr:hydroxysqualene dehydroxylase HpnE [Blastocatellia bacterium]